MGFSGCSVVSAVCARSSFTPVPKVSGGRLLKREMNLEKRRPKQPTSVSSVCGVSWLSVLNDFLWFEKPGMTRTTFHTSDKDMKEQGPKSMDQDSFDRPREQTVVEEFQGVLSAHRGNMALETVLDKTTAIKLTSLSPRLKLEFSWAVESGLVISTINDLSLCQAGAPLT